MAWLCGILNNCFLKYWCAIGCGVAFVYCFFLMEETNYDRQSQITSLHISRDDTQEAQTTIPSHEEKNDITNDTVAVENSPVSYPRKSYFQKLSLIDKKRENRILSIMSGPFRFFTYPVVVYAGLMYGANGLVWSGVLNSTAGTLYTKKYGFSTSDVAYAYLGGVAGVVVG